MNLAAIPESLRAVPNWLHWKTEIRDGRPTKPPYRAGQNVHADVANPQTWVTFERATETLNGNGVGLGFVLTKESDLVFVDLDDCITSGKIAPWASAIIDRLGSYTEYSPSGSGIHVLTRGSVPEACKREHCEIYSAGRYTTITGDCVPGTPAEIKAADTTWLYRLASSGAFDFSKNPKLEPLFNNQLAGFPSDSEADQSFCSTLARLGLGAEEIDNAVRTFRFREKWDKKRGKRTYGEWTIATALKSDSRERKREQDSQKQETARAAEAARIDRLKRLSIDPGKLVADLESYFEDRAFLPTGAALLLAFWCLHTWVFDRFATVPYLSIESATPECGKTHIMTLMQKVCCRARSLTRPSPAALYRLVDAQKPTLLLDEMEWIKGNSEGAETVVGIANAGYKKGNPVARCVGRDFVVQDFETFCPKAFAGVGGMEKLQALLTRCIVLHVDKRPSEFQITRCREPILVRDSAPLRELSEAYAVQFADSLQTIYDAEPDAGYWPELTDREAEIHGPLLVHARMIGPEMEARLLATINNFAAAKRAIQADESQTAKTLALLDVLQRRLKIPALAGEFYPSDLIDDLSENENWACTFAKQKTDETFRRKVLGASVGNFLGLFRLTAKKRTAHGKLFDLPQAIDVLKLHVPEQL